MVACTRMQHGEPARVGKSNFGLRFIETCIDSTLALDPGLNRANYDVDFSTITLFPRTAIDEFLSKHHEAREVNSDSLVRHDSTWIKYQYFSVPVIFFSDVKMMNDGTIVVHTSKTLSSDGAIRTAMAFEIEGDRIKCISSRITSIS